MFRLLYGLPVTAPSVVLVYECILSRIMSGLVEFGEGYAIDNGRERHSWTFLQISDAFLPVLGVDDNVGERGVVQNGQRTNGKPSMDGQRRADFSVVVATELDQNAGGKFRDELASTTIETSQVRNLFTLGNERRTTFEGPEAS